MRFKLTFTLQYDVDPAQFQATYGTTVPSEALDIDIANAKDDPALMIQMAAESEVNGPYDGITVVGEIVQDSAVQAEAKKFHDALTLGSDQRTDG